MEAIEEYLTLLQVAAVTAVACVLIVGAAADLFSIEPTGILDTGGGRPIHAQRYRGSVANASRFFVYGVGWFMSITYTTLLGAIIFSCVGKVGYFSASTLTIYFVLVVSTTMMAMCWIALLATKLRYDYMKSAGSHHPA